MLMRFMDSVGERGHAPELIEINSTHSWIRDLSLVRGDSCIKPNEKHITVRPGRCHNSKEDEHNTNEERGARQ